MTTQYHHRHRGISLVELMIALFLSSFLMLGVMRMFADSVSNNLSDTALAQVQDSARIAMELLKRDIRMAGFQGGVANTQTPVADSLIDMSQEEPLAIIDGRAPSGNSDSLNIFRAYLSDKPLNLSQPNGARGSVGILSFYNSEDQLEFDRNICYVADDIFLVTDGQKVASFKIKETISACTAATGKKSVTPIGKDNQTLNLQQFALPENCGSSTTAINNCPTLFQFSSDSGSNYIVQDRTDSDNNPIPASDGDPVSVLFLDNVEMVEGIENIQVLLGIRMSNGKIKYINGCTQSSINDNSCSLLNANEVITHVKITMVVASSFPVVTTNTAQSFPIPKADGTTIVLQTNDRRLRRVFTSTVQLRNSG